MYVCTYTAQVVTWDPAKAQANLDKHGIDFADAAAVLDDEMALTIPDETSDEERSVTLGMDSLGRILVVVYAWEGEQPRLISARKASKIQRRQYEGKR